MDMPYRPARRCRWRVELLAPGHFAVVERSTGAVVQAPFSDYRDGWCWIADALESSRDVD
jgi:hypothetical protein